MGSFIAGCHQELRFLLQHQNKENCTSSSKAAVFLKISRVNGTDTFQLEDKDEAQGGGDTCCSLENLPTLLELNTFPQTMITLQDVKTAFEQARNLMKRYGQSDCHALSQMICDLLVPGSFPAELDCIWKVLSAAVVNINISYFVVL